MARPRTPIGTFGEIYFEQTHDGRSRALTRFRDYDGQLRRVQATAATPPHPVVTPTSPAFPPRRSGAGRSGSSAARTSRTPGPTSLTWAGRWRLWPSKSPLGEAEARSQQPAAHAREASRTSVAPSGRPRAAGQGSPARDAANGRGVCTGDTRTARDRLPVHPAVRNGLLRRHQVLRANSDAVGRGVPPNRTSALLGLTNSARQSGVTAVTAPNRVPSASLLTAPARGRRRGLD